MKKIIILSFAILLVGKNFAQNVGIGTTIPAARLDVKTPSNYVAQFNGGTGMFMGIFENDIYRGYWGSYTGADEDVDFGTAAGNVLGKLHLTIQASPKLTIDVNGNVGIGTTTPAGTNKLHVHDATGGQDASIGITNSLTTAASLRGARLRMINSDFQIINYEATGAINLVTNFNTRLTINSNGNVGIGTTNPQFILHVEAGAHNGIFSRTTITNQDSGAIIGVLDVPTGANYRVAAVRGESKSITDASIGVYGIQNGGGWGIAGSVKEAGISGWGAGVYGEAGLNGFGTGTGGYGVYGSNANTGGSGGYFIDYNGSPTSYALKTGGKLKFTGIGEANSKVLTSDALGNAIWANLPGGANAWTVSGNNIYNSNTGFVGIGHNNPQYALDVRSNVKGSLFMENPIVNANATVRILRGIPESASYPTTALYVEASSDRAAKFIGALGGIVATSNSSTGAGALLDGNGGNGIALEINGAIKVNTSATNKSFFTHVTAAINISGNSTLLTYPNPASTDFVIVTSNWSAGPVYNNHPIGVYFTAGTWAIFNQDLVAMPVGTAFNVMVIRQ